MQLLLLIRAIQDIFNAYSKKNNKPLTTTDVNNVERKGSL